MLLSGTHHARRTRADEMDDVCTYWLEIVEGEQKGHFVVLQTYQPLNLKPLQEVEITIE